MFSRPSRRLAKSRTFTSVDMSIRETGFVMPQVHSSASTRRITREVGVDQYLIWNVLMAAAEIIRISK